MVHPPVRWVQIDQSLLSASPSERFACLREATFCRLT